MAHAAKLAFFALIYKFMAFELNTLNLFCRHHKKSYIHVTYIYVTFRIFAATKPQTAMTNSPFQYGSLAEKENFIDRVEDRALLKQLLMNGIHVMLISPRRWGKSSLVKVATDELVAENKNVRVCHIDAFSISSETEFYRTFASKVMSCAASKFEKGLKEMKNFLNAAVPQLVLKDDITEYLTFDIRFKPQEQEKLEILQLPEKIAASKGLRIIVCIDEFQQLARIPQYADMEGKMRSVWQRQHHVSYCFYGSKRHMMTDIFNDSSKPFYRFGQVIWLKKIEAKSTFFQTRAWFLGHWMPIVLVGRRVPPIE